MSKKPLAPTIWFSTTRSTSYTDKVESGSISILKEEDEQLLENLKGAYENEFIDIKATAGYDAVANTGAFTLEVILLGKVKLVVVGTLPASAPVSSGKRHVARC